MKEVKILHQVSGRDADIETRDDVMRGLTNGKYYLAGTIQVMGDVDYDNDEGVADWTEVLENAWMDSQNDTHPNCVVNRDGEPVTTLQELMSKYDYTTVQRHLKRDVLTVLPAVWNINDEAGPGEDHAFAQRSSMVGDLFVVEGSIFRAEGVGFKKIVSYNLLERKKGITLADNPWTPGGEYDAPQRAINEEFDELLTD